MRISKDDNGHILVDGEGQIIDTGIFIDCDNITISNFVLDVTGMSFMPSEVEIKEVVEDRIREMIREKLALEDFVTGSLLRNFELLDLGEQYV